MEWMDNIQAWEGGVEQAHMNATEGRPTRAKANYTITNTTTTATTCWSPSRYGRRGSDFIFVFSE